VTAVGVPDGRAALQMSPPAEFLYELWDANWDDGPLGNYQVLRHPIRRKTAKRIYFTFLNGRGGFVDRLQIERDGEIFHRASQSILYLTPPEAAALTARPSRAELRKAMAEAHPDRGGSDAEFIAARRRYEEAR
jgi:hypothetical protein